LGSNITTFDRTGTELRIAKPQEVIWSLGFNTQPIGQNLSKTGANTFFYGFENNEF
jgi:hypothetical protein